MNSKTAAALALAFIILSVTVVGYIVFKDYLESGSSEMGINALINYEDGTSETINSSERGLSPLSVFYPADDLRPLSTIQFQLWGKFTYQGNLSSIFSSGTIEFDFDGDGEHEKIETKEWQQQILPPSGGTIFLVKLVISSSELQGWATTSAEYTTTVRGRASIEITFTDGTTIQLKSERDTTATFTFKIEKMQTTSILNVEIIPWRLH